MTQDEKKPLTTLIIQEANGQWTLTEDFNGESKVIHWGSYDEVKARGWSVLRKSLPSKLILRNQNGVDEEIKDYSDFG